MRASKGGFTIVELMMVLGIIAVLMGIVTTAASSSVKSGREQKARALCAMVQSGLAVYREQQGEWPVRFDTSRSNNEGERNNTDPDKIVLTGAEVRQCVKALVDQTKLGNPMMDISGLFVSTSDGELPSAPDKDGKVRLRKAYGMDFMQAVRGTKQSQKKMKTSQMYFGYPDRDTGYFLRFKMVYSIPGDTITVSRQL